MDGNVTDKVLHKCSVIVIWLRFLTLRHNLVCGVNNVRLALICAVWWRGDGFVVASSDSDQKNATTGDRTQR